MRARSTELPPVSSTNLGDGGIFCDGDLFLVFRGFYCDLNDSSFRGFGFTIVVIPRICGALVSHLYSTNGTAHDWRQLPGQKRSDLFPEEIEGVHVCQRRFSLANVTGSIVPKQSFTLCSQVSKSYMLFQRKTFVISGYYRMFL